MIAFGLFAAADDWIRILIFVIFFGIAGLNQLIKNIRESQAKRVPPPPEGDPARRRVEAELEAFLRRAQQEGQGGASPPQPPPQPPQPRPPREKKQRKRQVKSEAVAAEVVEPGQPRRRLEPRLEQHIDTSRFEQRAKQLTKIEHEADDIDSHVHQVFDHQLGSLGGRSQVQSDQAAVPIDAESPAETAANLAALLANPTSIKNAIIMQEILARPTHRW